MKRPDSSSSREALTVIEETAADWFGRRDGGLTSVEANELAAWLAADPRHAQAFARLESASAALDNLIAFRPAASSTDRPDPDLPLRPRTDESPRRSRRLVWLAPTLAAAAAIAIALVIFRSPPATLSVPDSGQVATEVGGRRTQNLPDGSHIELNTDSRVEFAFTATERRITLLRGEAHFIVAKDSNRPFVVTAGGVGVRAVGTAFNVRLRDGGIDVLVTEGRVRVNDSARGDSLLPVATTTEPPVLIAGQRTVIPSAYLTDRQTAAPVVVRVHAPEISRLLAWQDQRLEFDPSPLQQVVAEFNRYNRHQLVVADEATAALSVGGSFRATDYETLVRLLEKNFGIVAERRGNETILRKRP